MKNTEDTPVKTIKAISNSRYEVILVRMSNGSFRVGYGRPGGEPQISEPVVDYKTAAYLFDIKVMEMEGN